MITSNIESWRITNYFDSSMRESDFGGGMIVPKYKRSIEAYSKAISSAGFSIKQLLEPRPLEEGKTVDPENYEKAIRLPQLLTLELIKLR